METQTEIEPSIEKLLKVLNNQLETLGEWNVDTKIRFINKHLKFETQIVDINTENLHDLGFGLYIMNFEL